MATSARMDPGTSGLFSGTLRDAAGVAIPLANINSATLTLRDGSSGTIVNSRDAQNVLNLNSVTIHATSGAISWSILPADTTLVGTTGETEEHVATFTITFETSKRLVFDHRIVCRGFLALCTVEDVELRRPRVAASERQFIEFLIDSVSARAEGETTRKFRRATRTETFSVDSWQRQIRVKAYPIESVTSIKESINGQFSTTTALQATEYDWSVLGHKGMIERRSGNRYDGLMNFGFLEGIGTVQVVYVGGYRDVASVPWDLRDAVATQVAYMHQRKDSLGISGESVDGKSISYSMAMDLLPSVKAVFAQHSPMRL